MAPARIEQAADAEADQKQLERIAYRAFVDVELGDVVMHRMRQPQRVPVVHSAVHPVLAEIEDEDDQESLNEKRQACEPDELVEVQPRLHRLNRSIGADVVVGQPHHCRRHADIEEVGRQFLPRDLPALVARVHEFEDLQKDAEADADADRGGGLRDRIGGIVPEGDHPEEDGGLEPGEEQALERAAFDLRNIFPADCNRRLGSNNALPDSNTVHSRPPWCGAARGGWQIFDGRQARSFGAFRAFSAAVLRRMRCGMSITIYYVRGSRAHTRPRRP